VRGGEGVEGEVDGGAASGVPASPGAAPAAREPGDPSDGGGREPLGGTRGREATE
jgi:hypothetical protein